MRIALFQGASVDGNVEAGLAQAEQALAAADLNDSAVHTHSAPAGLSARLRTPRGDITLTHTHP